MKLDALPAGFRPAKIMFGEKPTAGAVFYLLPSSGKFRKFRKTNYREGQTCLFGGGSGPSQAARPTWPRSTGSTVMRLDVLLSPAALHFPSHERPSINMY